MERDFVSVSYNDIASIPWSESNFFPKNLYFVCLKLFSAHHGNSYDKSLTSWIFVVQQFRIPHDLYFAMWPSIQRYVAKKEELEDTTTATSLDSCDSSAQKLEVK